MKKILTLALALIMVCSLFVACKDKKNDNVESYTVKLTIKNGENTLYGPSTLTVEDDGVSYPTVLDVILQYIEDSEGEITYETSTRTLAGKTSVEFVSIDSAKKDDSVFWQVLINDKTASINADIEDGDEIVFFLDKNADTTETVAETEAPVEVQTANDDYNG
jgi:hypothetical protein